MYVPFTILDTGMFTYMIRLQNMLFYAIFFDIKVYVCATFMKKICYVERLHIFYTDCSIVTTH